MGGNITTSEREMGQIEVCVVTQSGNHRCVLEPSDDFTEADAMGVEVGAACREAWTPEKVAAWKAFQAAALEE